MKNGQECSNCDNYLNGACHAGPIIRGGFPAVPAYEWCGLWTPLRPAVDEVTTPESPALSTRASAKPKARAKRGRRGKGA